MALLGGPGLTPTRLKSSVQGSSWSSSCRSSRGSCMRHSSPEGTSRACSSTTSPARYTSSRSISPVLAPCSADATSSPPMPSPAVAGSAGPAPPASPPASSPGSRVYCSCTFTSSLVSLLLVFSMPSAPARALSHSCSSSLTRLSSAAFSSATCSWISRRFWAICSSSRAWSLFILSSFSLRSRICSSFSAPSCFQLSMVPLRVEMVSFADFRRFSRVCLSLERLLARMSRPAGPSSRIWNRFSNCDSSRSNSSSLSSGGPADAGTTNFALRWASFKSACSFWFCFLSLPQSSETARTSVWALLSVACIFILSRMDSSRWTTARPSLSTRSAISLTRFLDFSSLPRAARPRCRRRTSWMCAFRISVIICMASCASLVSCPASRFASRRSRCSVSDCSRPFRNSFSSRWACASKASFFAEVIASRSWSVRTFRASLALSWRVCW
mmetsp:Transcript_5377/g.15238  ORF Transcript_5377/g.15238 Transcript_5377/m.15238 type:complete len:443 (-) Transcript_5377:374-1702(-)